MRKAVLIGWLVLWGTLAIAASPLSNPEKHRLAAYLSYITVTAPKSPVDESYKAGDICGACGGRGSVGDGVIESPCDFVTPDGLLACKGTGKLQSTGGMMDYEDIGEAMCDTCEATPLPPEVETPLLCPDCCCPVCNGDSQPEESQEETQPVEEPSCLVDLSQTKWNWQGTSNVPISTMRAHLTDEHSIDPASLDKMSREELIALHNLLHNEEVRATAPKAKSSGTSSSSCPSGTCPTSSSSSRSRGLFGRFR